MLEQIEKQKPSLSYSAYIRYKRTVKNLLAFNHGSPVLFSCLNYEFVAGYDYYLRNLRPKKTYHQNTIVNEHKVIKDYLQIAENIELVKVSKNPYLKFKKLEQLKGYK